MKITKIQINKNYSKYAEANISIFFDTGISLYSVEVKKNKEGQLFLSHQSSYKSKTGETKFVDYSFISSDVAKEILAIYVKSVENKEVEITSA